MSLVLDIIGYLFGSAGFTWTLGVGALHTGLATAAYGVAYVHAAMSRWWLVRPKGKRRLARRGGGEAEWVDATVRNVTTAQF